MNVLRMLKCVRVSWHVLQSTARLADEALCYLGFGLSMLAYVGGRSPPASEPKDGPLDMLREGKESEGRPTGM